MHATLNHKNLASNINLHNEAGQDRQQSVVLQNSPYPDLKTYFKEKKELLKQTDKKSKIPKVKKKKDYKNIAGEVTVSHPKDALGPDSSQAFFQDAYEFIRELFATNEILYSGIVTREELPSLQVVISYFDTQTGQFNKKTLDKEKLLDSDFLNELLYMKVGSRYGLKQPKSKLDPLAKTMLQNYDLAGRLQHQEAYGSRLDEIVQTQKEQLEEDSRRIKTLQSDLDHYSHQNSSLEQKLHEERLQYQQQLEQKDKTASEMQQQLESKQTQLHSLEAKLDETRQSFTDQNSQLQKQIESLEKEIKEKNQSIEALEEQKLTMQKEHEEALKENSMQTVLDDEDKNL